MLTRRITLPLVALLLAVSLGVWLGKTRFDGADLPVDDEGVARAGGADGQRNTSSLEAEAPQKTLPTRGELARVESSWMERYPKASLVDSRMVLTAAGLPRQQYLLSRPDSRIPWVLWEEKLEREEDGSFTSAGPIAHVGNVILIDADPNLVPAQELAAFVEEHGLFLERESAITNYICLGFERPQLGKAEALISDFQRRFVGAIAEFDTLSFPGATPSDWDASRMWGLDTIDAENAWQFETGSAADDVVIAVIDTGMQRTHPDLVDNLFRNPKEISGNGRDDDANDLVDDVSGWDFYDNDSNPQDDDGHGTHVAGIAGAVGNNGRGAVGVNWGVQILPLKVGNSQGLRTSAINDALAYVRVLKQDGVNIVATNNSYGSGGSNASTRNEIARHEQLGILFVAAAGNDGKNMDASASSREFPAGYDLDNIISVGNSNQEDTLNRSSNYGTTSVDISAPGSEIYSTYPTDSYNFLSGTSMASPMVAGAVGLLAQWQPVLSASQLKDRILSTGDLVESQSGRTLTGRRLNLLSALKPELSGHFVDVPNIRDAIVLVDSVGAEVVFEVEAQANASVAVEVVSGANVGDVRPAGDGIYRFAAEESGQAELRFSATLEGVVRSLSKTVVVGEAASVDLGLRHHYDFDGNGNFATNRAGGSGGAISGATRRNNEYGRSLGFDAASENMTFDGAFSDVVTIAALVRSDNLTVSPHPRIVNMPFYYLYFSSGNGLEFPDGNRQTLKFFSNYTNFGVWNTPPRTVQEGQWYFVVGTYDSTDISNIPKLFINGNEQEVRLQQPPEGSIVKTGGLSYVGNSDSGDRAFEGLMADVRIYDRALSAAEVRQLGASLVQDRWDSVSIDVASILAIDEPHTLQVLDTLGVADSLSVGWYFEESADVQVLSSSGTSAQIQFSSLGDHIVRAQVSDGVATRVFQKEVEILDGQLTDGHYVGSSEEGGLAWLEVDESLEKGVATVFDPESGFYRIREPVTIGVDGSFESAELSVGRIEGVALRSFTLNVPGKGLAFHGEQQAVPSSQLDLTGSYEGGGIGNPGDLIRMEVLSDGRVFLWREGPFADLAFGVHSIAGQLSLESVSGALVELQIDPSRKTVEGTWGGQRAYLIEASLERDRILRAGVVGGFPNGSGALGLYAEFIAPGEVPRRSLENGLFAQKGSLVGEGPFALLGSGGEWLFLDGDKSRAGIAATVASAVEQGRLSLDAKVVGGVRLQAPVSSDGVGLVGFSVEGSEPVEILVRGLGPSLSASGAEDPKLSVYRIAEGSAVPLLPNDNWRDGALFLEENESAQGAFRALASGFDALDLSPLDDDAKDAAQRVWLEPGDYLVLIELASGAAGSGLIEVLAL